MTSAAVASRTMSSAVNPAHRAPSLSCPSSAKSSSVGSSAASSSASSTSSSPNPKLLKAAQQSIETQRILPGHDEEIDSVEAEGNALETEEEKMMEVDEDMDGGVAMEIDDQREERNTSSGDIQNQKQQSTAAVGSIISTGGGTQQRGQNPAARPPLRITSTSSAAPASNVSAPTGPLVSNPMSVSNQALSSKAFVNSVVATRNANTSDTLATRPVLSGNLGVANPLAARPELPSPSPTSVSASASAKQAAAGGASGPGGAGGASAPGVKASSVATGTSNKGPAAPTSGTAKLSITAPAVRAPAGAPPGPSPTRRSKRRIQVSTKVAENDETKAVMEAMAQSAKSGSSGGLGATATATGRNPLAASDDGRSPVMTRRRTGVPETELLSSKARASLSPQSVPAPISESHPTPRTGNSTSTATNSKRQSAKSNRKSSSGKKSSSGSSKRNTNSPQPGVPNVMAAAAVTLSGVPPHAHHRLPHHPAMSMQLPSNPSSVAPSPLLSGASGPNNGNGGGGRARIFSIDLDCKLPAIVLFSL